MPNGFLTLAVAAAMQVGQPSPSEAPNAPPLRNAYNQYGFEGQYEQRYPFDTQQNWVHGYHQEIPAYGGYSAYRPYNYKDVLSQSQTAAGWGMSPTMPYSQQFWHRYHDQATMLKLSQSAPAAAPQTAPVMMPSAGASPGPWSPPMLPAPPAMATGAVYVPQVWPQPTMQPPTYDQPYYGQPSYGQPSYGQVYAQPAETVVPAGRVYPPRPQDRPLQVLPPRP